MATAKKQDSKLAPEDFWWLQNTKNPNDTVNETVTVINNIYCLCDFRGIKLEDFEESINIKPGSLKKILDDTEKEWNDNSTPIEKKELPKIGDNVVEKASEYFYVTEETLRSTALSPDFYYYTFGQPTSLNVQEANAENMKLILFIEKITLDCKNYVFNIEMFEEGDVNHFGAKYEIAYLQEPKYRFKINRDNIGSIYIEVGTGSIVDKLSFRSNHIIFPLLDRMENTLHEAAVRDAECKNRLVTNIPKNVFTVMDGFLGFSTPKKEDAKPAQQYIRSMDDFKEVESEESKDCEKCKKNKSVG